MYVLYKEEIKTNTTSRSNQLFRLLVFAFSVFHHSFTQLWFKNYITVVHIISNGQTKKPGNKIVAPRFKDAQILGFQVLPSDNYTLSTGKLYCVHMLFILHVKKHTGEFISLHIFLHTPLLFIRPPSTQDHCSSESNVVLIQNFPDHSYSVQI